MAEAAGTKKRPREICEEHDKPHFEGDTLIGHNSYQVAEAETGERIELPPAKRLLLDAQKDRTQPDIISAERLSASDVTRAVSCTPPGVFFIEPTKHNVQSAAVHHCISPTSTSYHGTFSPDTLLVSTQHAHIVSPQQEDFFDLNSNLHKTASNLEAHQSPKPVDTISVVPSKRLYILTRFFVGAAFVIGSWILLARQLQFYYGQRFMNFGQRLIASNSQNDTVTLMTTISHLQNQVDSLTQQKQALQQTLYHTLLHLHLYTAFLKHDLSQCHSQLILDRESALAAINTVARIATRDHFDQMHYLRLEQQEQLGTIIEGAVDAIIHVASVI